MGLLYLLLILGAALRLALLFLRPKAEARFHTIRRRLLATRAEQGGDVLVLFTAVCMLLFGGHHTSGVLEAFWFLCLVGGFGLVTFAHDIARRYRPDTPGSGPGSTGRPPTPAGRPRTGPANRNGAPPGTSRPPRPAGAGPARPAPAPGRPPGAPPRRPGPPDGSSTPLTAPAGRGPAATAR